MNTFIENVNLFKNDFFMIMNYMFKIIWLWSVRIKKFKILNIESWLIIIIDNINDIIKRF